MSLQIVIYFLLSFLLFYIITKISYKYSLVDLPNNRKLHTEATAFTGGLSISLILLASILLFDLSNIVFNLIISTSFLISLIGFIDDRYNLNVGGKLSLQIFPIFYLIAFQKLALNQLGDYGYFELNAGTFSLPLTLICVLFLINAFNYFDGIDGTISFATISVLSILYFLVSDREFQFFLIIIIIPICIFLCFNFSLFKLPKVFLGDSGSLLLGFIIAFILIYLANRDIIHPILLSWSIVIFVYEFIVVNLIRLKDNRNPFEAGRDHLHHILFKKTKSISITNFFISISNVFLFIIGYLSFSLINPLASLILFIFLFFIFLALRIKYSK